MAHASVNFKTKKELVEAVKSGRKIYLQSGMFPATVNGRDVVEGPWEYHKYYASVTVVDGYITTVK